MSSLSIALSQQMYGNKFNFLREKLGNEIVDSIPSIILPSNFAESAYPRPWARAEELPADVVKGVLPSGRPFLGIRFVIAATQKAVYEIFFQRYNDTVQPQIKELQANGNLTVRTISLSDPEQNWSSTDEDSNYAIHSSGGITDRQFELLKDILNGAALDKTEGRYLPLYAARFTQESQSNKAASTAIKA